MYQNVLDFWFQEIDPKSWWVKDADFDQLIRDRFLAVHEQAICGELFKWREQAEGRLAEIIVLDQFSRNMFRNSAQAFAYDPLALVLAQEAVYQGADKKLSQSQKNFLYMPFMHSESLAIHVVAVELFRQNGSESSFEFELKHMEIIERFGRYPHRNEILGRQSTTEEIEFLKQPGSGF
ncbi:MAG: DUF924 domain-containing protein [Deltaproteobacteria bacterium]|jgi:uncharacterized protein (DUF924 family)|nr:DUF924 domain-containing protein [Deltaproteobacteria bacterium]MCW8894070.1 DUF924 domain-containing protein [Deltaproteobacteria bacterium]MCW9049752.1 DUF924 domain-containing protein [Deltaproteobacteria bacterium]